MLTYQWRKDEKDLPGETSETLTLKDVAVTATGRYDVVVTNPAGKATSDPVVLTVGDPVRIVSQPLSQTATAGQTVTLRVVATGDPVLTYQWRLSGQNLPGKTQSELVLVVAGPQNGGSYDCIVANAEGAVISDVAFVTVPAPALPFADDFAARGSITGLSGQGVGSNATATTEPGEPRHADKVGGPSVWLRYVAPSEGTLEISTVGSDFDTLLAVYGGDSFARIASIASDDDSGEFYTSRVRFAVLEGQNYAIAVDGRSGSAGNIVFTWSFEVGATPPPRVVTGPQDRVAFLGETVTFDVLAAATASYRWLKDGALLANGPRVSGTRTPTLRITGVTVDDLASYSVELTGNGGVVSLPAALQINLGTSAASAPAKGTDDKYSDIRDGRGSVVSGGSSSTSSGGARLSASRPRPVGLARGTSGTLAFSTIGSLSEQGEPLHCGVQGGASQWFEYVAEFDGTLTVDTAGSNFDTVLAAYYDGCPACSAEEALARLVPLACGDDVSPTDKTSRMSLSITNGSIYSLVVDGVGGKSGKVKINYTAARNPPVITTQPFLQSANTGGSVTFTVAASGNAPFTYQWRRNGLDLPGRKNATLALVGVTVADSGSYDVVVANSVGSVTSTAATLVVQAPPAPAGPPVVGAPSLAPDGRVQFQVQGTVGAPVTIEMTTDFTTFNPVFKTNLPAAGFRFIDNSPPTVIRVFRAVSP